MPSCFIQGTRHKFQGRFFLLLFILTDIEFVFDKLRSHFSLTQRQRAQAVRSDKIRGLIPSGTPWKAVGAVFPSTQTLQAPALFDHIGHISEFAPCRICTSGEGGTFLAVRYQGPTPAFLCDIGHMSAVRAEQRGGDAAVWPSSCPSITTNH